MRKMASESGCMSLRGILFFLGCCLWVLEVVAKEDKAMGIPEKTFHTGLTGKGGTFAVSPDGGRLLFTTGSLNDGLKVLDLHSGGVAAVPIEKNRIWEMPSWSYDGKEVVAISTAVRNNHYIVGEMQVVLLDPKTWTQRVVSTGEGVKIFPFFSSDGKAIFYFKGTKRDGGATHASRYDLYTILLTTGREQRLTHEQFYQVIPGDSYASDGTVLFSAIGGKYFGELERKLDKRGISFLAIYDTQEKKLRHVSIDESDRAFQFRGPVRDKNGNIYFAAAALRANGGPFRWFIFRADPFRNVPIALTEIATPHDFALARMTGEIYVMDKQGDEIVFRRHKVPAEH